MGSIINTSKEGAKTNANSIIQKVEMIEKNRDKTIIELKNVKLNKPVNANSFS